MIRTMAINAVILGAFAVMGTALVSYTHQAASPLIAENERQAVLEQLNHLIDPTQYNNPILEDTIERTDPLLGSSQPKRIFRARRDGQPVALILEASAPNGYSGEIKLLVAIRYEGTVAGVRVLYHKETPGLGDKIELHRSNWILSFNDRSLTNPPESLWRVKKDGGIFDQFTGATITPRAVVAAVYNALHWVQRDRDALFNAPALHPNATGAQP